MNITDPARAFFAWKHYHPHESEDPQAVWGAAWRAGGRAAMHHVRLQVDSKGYIRELEVLEDDGRKSRHPVVISDRDRTISRLAVLKAAAEFGASRPDLKSGDVLKIAASWLAWIKADS